MESQSYTLDSDEEYLKQLQVWVERDIVRLECDARKLTALDSPVAVQAEKERWAMATVVLAGIGWWQGGPWAALGAGVAVLVAYAVFGRRHGAKLIERRVREKALKEIDLWRKLWRHGGVRLIFTPERPSPVCASPDQSWIQFVEAILRAREPKTSAN